MIRFKDVELGYRRDTVLTHLNCEIEEGDYVGLVGPNGAGKTTFLRAILGLIQPKFGTIERDTTRRFAYVPQLDDFNRLWPLSVSNVVALAQRSRRLFGRLTPEEKSAINDLMKRAGIWDIAEKKFSDISGGQRQRTILAQALSQKPDVLLLDEPTRGLDVVFEKEFLDTVNEFRQQAQLTILLVTHTLEIPLNHTKKILLFEKGQVITTNPTEIIKEKKLEEIYGTSFVQQEHKGYRWVYPTGEKK